MTEATQTFNSVDEIIADIQQRINAGASSAGQSDNRGAILTEFVRRLCEGEEVWDILTAMSVVAGETMAAHANHQMLYETFDVVVRGVLDAGLTYYGKRTLN